MASEEQHAVNAQDPPADEQEVSLLRLKYTNDEGTMRRVLACLVALS